MNHQILKSFNLSINIFIFISIFSVSSLTAQNRFEEIKLISPPDGAVLSNNIPALVWSGVKADKYEVWIDNKCMAKVDADRHRVIPFPLSFGQHIWYVIAIQGSQRKMSPQYQFTIKDTPVG